MRGQGLLLLAAAVGLGYGGGQFGLTLVGQRAAPPAPVQIGAALAAVENAAGDPVPDDWPAVFDPYVPDPPKAQTPPKKVEKYRLIGLVADGAAGWAILSASDGDQIVRKGDRLIGGETVLAIEGEGVRIERDGAPVLIAFEETREEMFNRIVGGTAVETETDLPVSVFAGRDMRRVLGRAGSIRMIAPNGGRGDLVPEILWVREGQLYDLIGLKRGDVVLRVNGYSVSDPETLENAKAILGESDQFAVEILRAGQRRTITVRITGRG
jgi:general secretion pathway protein C